MNILIADDDKETCRLMQRYLEKKGHCVDAAFDGDSALRTIMIKKYHLIFLDENMPGLTGHEILKYVKHSGLKTKVAIFTGYPLIDEDFVRTLGADAYIEKPAQPQKLDEILKTFEEI